MMSTTIGSLIDYLKGLDEDDVIVVTWWGSGDIEQYFEHDADTASELWPEIADRFASEEGDYVIECGNLALDSIMGEEVTA
jgi:hypothetical protein